MATIVIDEFEVVAAPPRAEAAGGVAVVPAASPVPVPTPHDIVSVQRRHWERLARVRAH